MFTRWLKIDPAKSALILGPRRAGKTTYLKQNFPEYHYITLDDMDYLNWAKRDPKGLINSLGPKVIIDEIQRRPDLTVAIKYGIDEQNKIFFLTGSSSIGLMDTSADTLAGRINLYHLPTLCFGEEEGPANHNIFDDELNPVELQNATRALNMAVKYGQFPEILSAKNETEKAGLLKNYRDTYFIRDVMQLSNIGNVDGLLSIFLHLVRSIGSHLEISNFAREAGLSHATTKKYLDVLQQAQLTFRLYGYQYGPAKRLIKSAKTYFIDNGIIQSMSLNVGEGQLLENFVVAEIEKRRRLGQIDTDRLYYYQSSAGRKIDLIFEAHGFIHAIEIKNTSKPSLRDIKNLKDFKTQSRQPVRCYLFYNGPEYMNIDDIKLIPVGALCRGW